MIEIETQRSKQQEQEPLASKYEKVMPYPHLSDARHPRPLAIPALVILHGNSVLHYVKLLYRYVKKVEG